MVWSPSGDAVHFRAKTAIAAEIRLLLKLGAFRLRPPSGIGFAGAGAHLKCMTLPADIEKNQIKLLSTIDIDEVVPAIADIILEIGSPQAIAVLAWDPD